MYLNDKQRLVLLFYDKGSLGPLLNILNLFFSEF